MNRVIAFILTVGAALFVPANSFAADGLLGVQLTESGGEVIITKVFPDSSAERVGLTRGHRIKKIGTTDIKAIDDVQRAKDMVQNGIPVPFVFGSSTGDFTFNGTFGQKFVEYTAPAKTVP